MSLSKIHGVLGLTGLIVVWASILVSILVSGCFNIFSMALSDLGDWLTACNGDLECLYSCNRLSEPIFSYGLIVSGILLAIASIGLYRRERQFYAVLLVVASISLAFVGILPERYGVYHFLAALLFFLLLPISMVFFVVSRWRSSRFFSMLSMFLSMVSLSGVVLFIYIKLYDVDLGYAIPEIIGALPASLWLGILFSNVLIKK